MEKSAEQFVQLHIDMDVDPSREKEIVDNFHGAFKPTMSRQPGYVDVRLMRLRSAVVGPAPDGPNYRMLISFRTEEERLTWVATDDHQRVWPLIESCIKGQNWGAVLYDPT